MHEIFKNTKELKDFLFRITKNKNEEKITIVFSNDWFLSFNGFKNKPFFGKNVNLKSLKSFVDENIYEDIHITSLPKHTQSQILEYANKCLQDDIKKCLEIFEKSDRLPRENVISNTSLPDCAGSGLYREHSLFYVKCGQNEIEDRGPYKNFSEAFIATLPDRYSLSEDNYHPKENPS